MTEIKFQSEMPVTLVDYMGSDNSVVQAMLASTNTIDAAEDLERTPGRINYLMRDKHGSPFEHSALQFIVEAPIKVFREWHRHRIGFSYNEQSGRYIIMPPLFYIPPPERPLLQVGKPGHYTYVMADDNTYNITIDILKNSHKHAYETYKLLLDRGIAKEAARDVLGTGLFSKMMVTLNLRSAFSFLALRTDDPRALHPSKPMWEIEQCARQIEEYVVNLFPLSYAAFNANQRVAP